MKNMNDNKIIITTSHKPSPKLRTFIKELASIIPHSIRINRGKKTLDDLLLDALTLNANRIIVGFEKKGNPSALRFFIIKNKRLIKLMTLKIAGLSLWRELAEASKVYNPKSIAVKIPEEELLELAEEIALGFNADILYDESKYKEYDVIVSLKPRGRIVLLLFINPSTNRIVGPILKISI